MRRQCKSSETPISWNEAGPQGPQGRRGPPVLKVLPDRKDRDGGRRACRSARAAGGRQVRPARRDPPVRLHLPTNLRQQREGRDGGARRHRRHRLPGKLPTDLHVPTTTNVRQQRAGREQSSVTAKTTLPVRLAANRPALNPIPMCGNDTLEAGEECDGTDAIGCPGKCLANCTCPLQCPLDGGDTACRSYKGSADINPGCQACCGADAACGASALCQIAALVDCADVSLNASCAALINAAGCADLCCTSCPSGGDIPTCQAAIGRPECRSCCGSTFACLIPCSSVYQNGCADPVANAQCGAAVNAAGCGFACCP